MTKGIMISWISVNHDPYYAIDRKGTFPEPSDGLLPGPSVSLAIDREWGPKLSRYVLFHQQQHEGQARTLAVAIARARETAGLPPLEVELRNMGAFNPTNHSAILERVTPALSNLLSRYPYGADPFHPGSPLWEHWGEANLDLVGRTPTEVLLEDSRWHEEHRNEYFICVSQGTPAMHAVWLVLIQAEVIRAGLVQTIPPQVRQAGQAGAEVVQLVQLDIGKLPIPTVETLKQSARREWDELRKLGGVAVLSHFMAANQYRDDHSYGLYRLTHTPTSRQQVEECLGRIGGDLDDVRDLLSAETLGIVERFVMQARAALESGWEKYVTWSSQERDSVKARLRMSIKEWASELHSQFRGLSVSAEWNEDAEFFLELYCDRDVVCRGLNAIVENVANHAYTENDSKACPLGIHVSLNEERLELVIEDRGIGFPHPAGKFQRVAGCTGGGLADIKRLTTWFQVRIDSTSTVSYDLATSEEKPLCGLHTGTRYVLTCRLPPTLGSRASEQVK